MRQHYPDDRGKLKPENRGSRRLFVSSLLVHRGQPC